MMIVPNDKLAIRRNCCTYTMNNILYKTRISHKSPSAEGTQDTTTWLLVESVEDRVYACIKLGSECVTGSITLLN